MSGGKRNVMKPSQLSNSTLYLVEPLILASPEAGKTLFVYLAVSNVLVSAALVKEDENRKQRLVFFVNKSLADVETRYNHLEQAALALRVATKKLRL